MTGLRREGDGERGDQDVRPRKKRKWDKENMSVNEKTCHGGGKNKLSEFKSLEEET